MEPPAPWSSRPEHNQTECRAVYLTEGLTGLWYRAAAGCAGKGGHHDQQVPLPAPRPSRAQSPSARGLRQLRRPILVAAWLGVASGGIIIKPTAGTGRMSYGSATY
jgi:hypothetical protein